MVRSRNRTTLQFPFRYKEVDFRDVRQQETSARNSEAFSSERKDLVNFCAHYSESGWEPKCVATLVRSLLELSYPVLLVLSFKKNLILYFLLDWRKRPKINTYLCKTVIYNSEIRFGTNTAGQILVFYGRSATTAAFVCSVWEIIFAGTKICRVLILVFSAKYLQLWILEVAAHFLRFSVTDKDYYEMIFGSTISWMLLWDLPDSGKSITALFSKNSLWNFELSS